MNRSDRFYGIQNQPLARGHELRAGAVVLMTAGRTVVRMTLLAGERITYDESDETWNASAQTFDGEPGTWLAIGSYATKEEAARALYTERNGFSAAYGA